MLGAYEITRENVVTGYCVYVLTISDRAIIANILTSLLVITALIALCSKRDIYSYEEVEILVADFHARRSGVDSCF